VRCRRRRAEHFNRIAKPLGRHAHPGTLAVLFALALWLVPPPATAQQLACQPQGEISVCRVEGFGSVINGDVAQARDEALIDARRRALEQTAGVQVDADTLTRNQVLFDQIVRTQVKGLVQSERVLADGPTNDGRFRVEIEAWVKSGEVQQRIESLLSELSLVVILPEQNLGQPQSQPVAENELVTRLVDAGFRVLDQTQVHRIAKRNQVAALLRGDEDAVREIALRFMSNLLVTGEATTQFSQNNQGIISAVARITARVIEAETAKVVANVSITERGFAGNPAMAGQNALAAGGKRAAEQLLQALDGYFKRKDRQIEVRVRRLPSLDAYRQAKVFLEKQRWVSAVSEGGYALDESVLILTFPEKTLYLAARIGREQRYRLVEFDRGRILIEYRP
jgi:hypothetical protein